MNIIKKGIFAAALAGTALATTTPAMARDYYRDHDNTAAVAIGAGIIGLAVGAIAASDHHDRYRDRRYYSNDDWRYRDGYYFDRSGRRYSHDDWQRRYRGGWDGDRHDHDRYDRDRYYSRRGY